MSQTDIAPETRMQGPGTNEKAFNCIRNWGGNVKILGGHVSTPPGWPDTKVEQCRGPTGQQRALTDGSQMAVIIPTALGTFWHPRVHPREILAHEAFSQCPLTLFVMAPNGNNLNINQERNGWMSCHICVGEYYAARKTHKLQLHVLSQTECWFFPDTAESLQK